MSIVIDASVALKWVLDEPGSDKARLLAEQALIAPSIWIAEAANSLWRRCRIGDITANDARVRLNELRTAPILPVDFEPLIDEALGLALEMGHPVYDCIYLALALRHDTEVVTADRRFDAAVGRSTLSGRVRLLYQEP